MVDVMHVKGFGGRRSAVGGGRQNYANAGHQQHHHGKASRGPSHDHKGANQEAWLGGLLDLTDKLRPRTTRGLTPTRLAA